MGCRYWWGDAFVNAEIVLNLALIADGDIGADDNVLADVAVFTDRGS